MNVLEKILEEIEKIEEEYRQKEHSHVFRMGALSMAIDAKQIIRSHMNDVPDTNVGKWITVSERLPEDEKSVLVTVNGRCRNITFDDAIEFACYYKEEGWIIEAFPEWDNPDVIAWMELPEPYKPEEE